MHYALGDLHPTRILEPGDPQALAEFLLEAAETGAAVVPWGAGTRQGLGALPERYDWALDVTRLKQVLEYIPADLTITLQAGIRLQAVQQILGQHQQWLPWLPPGGGEGTLGGLLASAAVGPLRQGYGAPRDWILGMQVALPDGRLARSGGRVVKNVAGYDLHKLHPGAFGTLGVITEVTLKVFPQPDSIGAVLAALPDLSLALQLAEQIRRPPLAPIVLATLSAQAVPPSGPLAELAAARPGCTLLVAAYAGSEAAVLRQLRAATAALTEVEAEQITLVGEACTRCWEQLAELPAGGADSLLLRAGAPPAGVARLLETLSITGQPIPCVALPGIGLIMARWPLNTAAVLSEQLAAVRQIAAGLGGYLVVEQAPAQLRQQLDLWGPPPAAIGLMRGLRARWDPLRILNPGRFLVP